MVFFGCCSPKKSCFTKNVGNRSRLFSGFTEFIPECMEIWSCLKHTFKATIICNLKQLPLLACTRSIYLAYSQMVQGSIPPYLWSLLWLGSSVQTILKAKLFVYAPPGRKEDSDLVSFKISANVWSMSAIPVFAHCPHNSRLPLNAAILSADLNTVVILPWSDRLSLLSKMNMSHK